LNKIAASRNFLQLLEEEKKIFQQISAKYQIG
jgi:hypothetical protein